MNWNELSTSSQLAELMERSHETAVLIFKHSTRCSISAMALHRMERKWQDGNVKPYFLDLIRYRDISNQIEHELKVMHQSPQAILLKDGKVVYEASHTSIDFVEIKAIANDLETA